MLTHSASKLSKHIVWVDWMKVIGMYFIIVGHFFPVGNAFVYSFNVPLFFLISGFLCKSDEPSNVFWRKLWSNLIVPLIIICLFSCFFNCVVDWLQGNVISMKKLSMRWVMIFSGIEGEGLDSGGLGVCWFIYTLMLLKIIINYINHIWYSLFVLVICVLVAHYLNYKHLALSSSIANVSVAYPFFLTGFILKKYAFKITEWITSFSLIKIISTLIILFIVTFAISKVNSAPWMYKNGFGVNYLLFYIGGISGTMLIFIISIKLNVFNGKILEMLSLGTIIILGFHGYFIMATNLVSGHILKLHLNITSYLVAALILLVFYPIILFFKSYFPIILGSRAKS